MPSATEGESGSPSPSRNGFAGFRSRRIDSRHRLVHWIASDAQSVHGVSCRYHYGA
ncbi:putative toxin-antitoxin system, toxin component, RelE family [Schaalia georgiae F0490]|uniref:Endoribonuclease YoeB n=1 Tax=Schaalia georgiae F0490 TaxID=1125717 RepID=J1GTK0_9ACTO|nr:putative toxin-antitoxin system, toxin component, RelE family [Schaalia georgiae F0490]